LQFTQTAERVSTKTRSPALLAVSARLACCGVTCTYLASRP